MQILKTAKEQHYKDILDTNLLDETVYYNLPKTESMMNTWAWIYHKSRRKRIKLVKFMGKNHILWSDLAILLNS